MNSSSARKPEGKNTAGETFFAKIMRFILIILFDAGAVWFIQSALAKGFDQLVFIIGIITVMLNFIFLFQ